MDAEKQGNSTVSGGAKVPGGKKKADESKEAWRARILRRLYITLTVISALVVAVYVGWNLFSAPPDVKHPENTRRPEVTTTVDPMGNVVETQRPQLSSDRKENFYTVLIVGRDTYGGGNTDTMMLAAYDVKNQTAGLMSLPRDTLVNYNGRQVLLNSVYNRAGGGEKGIEALKEEIEAITGVKPDFHVFIRWEAVGQLVDAIGGVDFDVPRNMYYNDLSQNFKIDLKKGFQHLDGDKAMQLIRWRHDSDDEGHILNKGYATGDLGRIKTQQDFMKAVIKKCLQPQVLLSNLVDYVAIFLENVTTDLTASNLAYFGKSAIGQMDIDSILFMTMPYQDAGDGAHVVPAGEKLVEAVNESFNPYLEGIRLGELDLVTQRTSGSTVTPRPTSSPSPTAAPKPTEGPEISQPPTEPTVTETEPPDAPGETAAQPSAEPIPAAASTPEAESRPTPTPVKEEQPAPTPKADVAVLPPMPTPVPTQ